MVVQVQAVGNRGRGAGVRVLHDQDRVPRVALGADLVTLDGSAKLTVRDAALVCWVALSIVDQNSVGADAALGGGSDFDAPLDGDALALSVGVDVVSFVTGFAIAVLFIADAFWNFGCGSFARSA